MTEETLIYAPVGFPFLVSCRLCKTPVMWTDSSPDQVLGRAVRFDGSTLHADDILPSCSCGDRWMWVKCHDIHRGRESVAV